MRYVIAFFLLTLSSACATIDVNVCEQKEWQDSCLCNRDQPKCERTRGKANL